MSRAFRLALPASIAFLAFVVGATGIIHSAGASTGSIVNIADGTTAANLAKVDATGALRTSVASGTLSARPVVPNSPFHLDQVIPNFYSNGFSLTTVLGPTNAVLALSNIAGMLESTLGVAWDGAVWLTPATASACGSSTIRKSLLAVPAADMRQLNYGDAPLLLKAPPGSSYWCLKASFGPLNGSSSDSSSFYLQATGYVVSGAFTSPATATAPSTKTPSGHSATGAAPSSFTVVPTPDGP